MGWSTGQALRNRTTFYSISLSSNTQELNGGTTRVNWSSSVKFGNWYYWGVRLHVAVDGVEVGSWAGACTSKGQTVIDVSGHRDIGRGTSYRGVTVSAWTTSETVNGYGGVGTTTSCQHSEGINAKPSYTIAYNANGGSGAPGDQTRWYGQSDFHLSSTRPTRTGYTFQGWSTSNDSSVEYQPGQHYGGDANLTLYAVWSVNTWTVSYNANGGSGAPGNQTKVYGQTLTLSSTRPTRSLYNFIGWGTSSSSTTPSYQPGGAYTNNASTTLYAVWELAWLQPRITNLQATRCDSAGTFNEEGQYAKVTFNWATDRTVSAIKVVCNGVTVNGSGSGTSGSISLVLGNNALSTENSYPVTVTVTDSVGSGSMSTTVAPMNYIMDIAPNGSVAFGKPANPNFREIAIDKPIQASKPTYGGQHSSNGGTGGYYKIFTVISRMAYANSGIRVPIYQRGRLPSILLFRLIMGNSSTINGIKEPMVLGYTDVWYKVNGSSVDFYSKKTEGYDQICVGQPEYDPRYMSGISFDFASAFYTSLPSGVTKVMNIHQDELMQLKSANGYWGMTHPGGDNDWLRTTKNGLIPYQSGGASALGTESWPFNNVWTNNLNWTGNGIRGRVMKQIWSGNAGSGATINVPEFPYYNLFAFYFGSSAPYDVALIDRRNLTSSGSIGAVYGSGWGGVNIHGCSITLVSSTSLKFNNAGYLTLFGNSTSSAWTNVNLRIIKGIL